MSEPAGEVAELDGDALEREGVVVAGVELRRDAHGRLTDGAIVFWRDRVSLPGVERVRWSSPGTHGTAPTLREAIAASRASE